MCSPTRSNSLNVFRAKRRVAAPGMSLKPDGLSSRLICGSRAMLNKVWTFWRRPRLGQGGVAAAIKKIPASKTAADGADRSNQLASLSHRATLYPDVYRTAPSAPIKGTGPFFFRARPPRLGQGGDDASVTHSPRCPNSRVRSIPARNPK